MQVKEEYFHIKDKCKEGLLKHLQKVISFISLAKEIEILDIGCGSGVPS